jgi:hypothetical protein
MKTLFILTILFFSACEDSSSSTSSTKETQEENKTEPIDISNDLNETEPIDTSNDLNETESIDISNDLNETESIDISNDLNETEPIDISNDLNETEPIENNITGRGGSFSSDTMFPPNIEIDPETPIYIAPILEAEILKNKEVKILSGEIEDMKLSNSFFWRISGEVTVFGDLEIEAGTVLFGEDSISVLTIEKSGKILANGNQKNPIIFTTLKDLDPLQGYPKWGGIRIFGDQNSSGGVLKYVQIKAGGSRNYNGLLLDSVNEKLVVEYLHIDESERNGIYLKSGNVNLRHILVTGAKGDGILIDGDWSGKMENIYIKQERNNFGENSAGLQISGGSDQRMIISNLTIASESSEAGDGIHLQSGSFIKLMNSIVTGSRSGACIYADDSLDNIENYEFNSTVLGLCSGGTFLSSGNGKSILIEKFKTGGNNVSIASSIPYLSKLAKPIETQKVDSWFDKYIEYFIGAFPPDSNRTWWDSWTSE